MRYMEYVFPHCGLEKVTDQFMLGEKYLVAPLYEQGKSERNVFLPPGLWQNAQKQIQGSRHQTICVSSDELLGLFERVE